jgi:superfamily I DNA/RNA helicase
MAKSMDDEIRVFYVGVTRAKRLLDVVSTGFDLFEEN